MTADGKPKQPKFKPLGAARAVRDSDLPLRERCVAYVYVLAANPQRLAWPGARSVAAGSGLHERTVRKARDELVRVGFLVPTGTRGRAPLYRLEPGALAMSTRRDDKQADLFATPGGAPAVGNPKPGGAPAVVENHTGPVGFKTGRVGPETGRSARLTVLELLRTAQERARLTGAAVSLPKESQAEIVGHLVDLWWDTWQARRASRRWPGRSGKPKGYPRCKPEPVPPQVKVALTRVAWDFERLDLLIRWAFSSTDFDARNLRGEIRRGDPVRLDLSSLLRHRDGQLERRLSLAEQWTGDAATRPGEFKPAQPQLVDDPDDWRSVAEREGSGDDF